MKQYITPSHIANTIRMSRSLHAGSFLLTEGDTDSKLFKNLIKNKKCMIINSLNKLNAIDALTILERSDFQGILAIVDADFDMLETQVTSPNLLFTDTHDLETLLIQSPAFEKILTEFASQEKMEQFAKKHLVTDLRTLLLNSGKKIGHLRLLSLKENLALKFEGLVFSKFTDRETLKIEYINLIRTVKHNSQKHGINETDVINKLSALENYNYDLWYVCCGHDIIQILSIGLCKALGSNDTNAVSSEIIEKSLRLAFEYTHFTKTSLFKSIKEWQNNNKPYTVLEE